MILFEDFFKLYLILEYLVFYVQKNRRFLMRKKDISRYNLNSKDLRRLTGERSLLAKGLLTAGAILLINVTVFVLIFVGYIISVVNDRVEYDVRANKLQLTSIIYVMDENGKMKEYNKAYSAENRIWVDFNEMPKYMKDAIIAIEDKRFYAHHGVDWIRTVGAVCNLALGTGSYGGSTLTQQAIKNLTGENDVSITRKIKEIFRAINFEKEYSKDEILELYLNIVNFGNGCRGVQAAANTYFDKDIKNCSLAECAAIAGITQNPTKYNPLLYPENNQERRETVLSEMLDQGKIGQDEFDRAMEESRELVFSKSHKPESVAANVPIRNWYVEALFKDIVEDLMAKYKISRASAQDILFKQGLKIYCAVDEKAQSAAESVISTESLMPKDKNLELGYMMMNYDGRVLASVGSRSKKTGNMLFDRANSAKRQAGSCIKPISVYAPAIDMGLYNYGSVVKDEPLPNFYGRGKPGPNNWYKSYKGRVPLVWAIQQSANAPAAQTLQELTYQKSFDFLTQKLGFAHLDPEDRTSGGALALGGFHGGATVREMTAAFQIFGNGGMYNKPYTYFYVLDRNGKVLLDNRDNIGRRAISSQTATIMNRLLRQVIVAGTGRGADIENWEVVGKTGTTNDDKDSWFVGLTPEAVAGIWTGYDSPKRIRETAYAKRIWREIMVRFLEGKAAKTYNFDPNVRTCRYQLNSGEFAATDDGTATAIGYFANNDMPKGYVEYSNMPNSGGEAGLGHNLSEVESGLGPNSEVVIPGQEEIPEDLIE